LRRSGVWQHRFGRLNARRGSGGDTGVELLRFGTALAAQRFQLGQAPPRLFNRALFHQRFALARDRGQVARLARQRFAVIADRLALQAVGTGGFGEPQEDRRMPRIDRQRRLERVDRALRIALRQRRFALLLGMWAQRVAILALPFMILIGLICIVLLLPVVRMLLGRRARIDQKLG